MTLFWWTIAVGLLLNVAVGLWFITRREGDTNSLLATLLLGTTGVALALIMGKASPHDHGVDIALVFALLTGVVGITFVRKGLISKFGKAEGEKRND